jgi:hypothetical protein
MKMHVLPWITGRKDGNMGEPGPMPPYKLATPLTQSLEGCIPELLGLSELHSCPQICSPHRVADAMFLRADFYLSTKSRGVSREALLFTFDGAVSGQRTFSNKPNATQWTTAVASAQRREQRNNATNELIKFIGDDVKASAPKPPCKIPFAQKMRRSAIIANRPKNPLSQTIGPNEEQRCSSGNLIHWEDHWSNARLDQSC